MEVNNFRQDYFINATLLRHHLIILDSFEINPLPEELKADRDIKVKLFDGSASRLFHGCHIDNHESRRLRLPYEVMFWIRKTYPFSAAYFAGNDRRKGIWTKTDRKAFYKALQDKERKMEIPGETIVIAWETEGDDAPYLSISEGFRITEENATDFLSDQALASVLPYIFSSVRNTSGAEPRTGGRKCYMISETTNWLSAEEYSATNFSHPGVYLLRRKTKDGKTGYAYYVGKAADIKDRILTNRTKNGLYHYEDKSRIYDEVACISINLDDIKNEYGVLNESSVTPADNPGVQSGSQTDHVLYAIEDFAIHVVAMILKGEGKTLDNQQYRSYTSAWLKN